MNPETEIHRFTRVKFTRFKAFKNYTVNLKHFNVLVGPNNAGKSTIIAAFRILAAALRVANRRKVTIVDGPQGSVHGYRVELASISVAEENIFYNYEDTSDATITFRLSNGNSLQLYFPEVGLCFLIPDSQRRLTLTPSGFKKQFNCSIGFVPILGPVDHHESLFKKEAAQRALFNYLASRNFRNIWYHYPDKFEQFRETLKETWPGMDIEAPEIDHSHIKPRLYMFCPEGRYPRELFWSGLGFQVWCQMLTHLIQSENYSIFLIDEPDIYLHSELQRQLLGLLRNFGPDVLIATHSTEIITEAETDEIVLINKDRKTSKRLKNPSQLGEVFSALGSNTNPVLTQLAKTQRALFVEGKDFQILGKFARKLGKLEVANRRQFAVVPVGGVNPQRIKALKDGIEATLGTKIITAAIFDRDYRGSDECNAIKKECKKFCDFVVIHKRKEIENFLLIPGAIDRAMRRRLADQNKRSGGKKVYELEMGNILSQHAETKKHYVNSQAMFKYSQFAKVNSQGIHETQLSEKIMAVIEKLWEDSEERLKLISGKDALAAISDCTQKECGVNITSTAIIDAMRFDEVPTEMKDLIQLLVEFSATSVIK